MEVPLDFPPARWDLACFSFRMDAWKMNDFMGRHTTQAVTATKILLTCRAWCHGCLTETQGLLLDEAFEYALVCRNG